MPHVSDRAATPPVFPYNVEVRLFGPGDGVPRPVKVNDIGIGEIMSPDEVSVWRCYCSLADELRAARAERDAARAEAERLRAEAPSPAATPSKSAPARDGKVPRV